MVIDLYRNTLVTMMDSLIKNETEKIRLASVKIAEKLIGGGILYAFGTGHSHCVAEEMCGRAGGLAPVDAILESSLIGATGFNKSQLLERLCGFAEPILEHRGVTDRDALLIISNSGRNSVPVELAIKAKERKVLTIGITSIRHSKYAGPLNKYNKCLYDIVDIAIDNQGVVGDACIRLDGMEQQICSTSNIMSSFIAQLICGQICEIMLERGIEPPVLLSGNLDGADEKNKKLFDKYKGRVKSW
jgi:uncharacterized phosphosugar-binding protein